MVSLGRKETLLPMEWKKLLMEESTRLPMFSQQFALLGFEGDGISSLLLKDDFDLFQRKEAERTDAASIVPDISNFATLAHFPCLALVVVVTYSPLWWVRCLVGRWFLFASLFLRPRHTR